MTRQEAFVRLRIRARRILDDLHQGFFGTEDDHPRPIPSALCAAAPPIPRLLAEPRACH